MMTTMMMTMLMLLLLMMNQPIIQSTNQPTGKVRFKQVC
jgi:hypothetical protein